MYWGLSGGVGIYHHLTRDALHTPAPFVDLNRLTVAHLKLFSQLQSVMIAVKIKTHAHFSNLF
jgi:hypothetical protein